MISARSDHQGSPTSEENGGDHCAAAIAGHQRSNAGYVLGVVLAAMTVGLLIITALLGMAFATHRAAIAQQRLAAEQRAADGALETALVRSRAAFNGPGAPELCGAFDGAPAEVDQVSTDSGTSGTADDVTVRVRCEDVLTNGVADKGLVRLEGTDYLQAPGGTDWVGWTWTSALGSQSPPTADLIKPTLIHNAAEPLLFNGSVLARSGAAALLDHPSSSGALEVAGSYAQGEPGYPGSGTQCAMLDLSTTLLPDDSDLSRTAVVDADAAPTCGSDEVKALENTPVSDGPTGLPHSAAVPTSCPGTGGTVTFGPGDYTAADVVRLNALFNGSCANVYNFTAGNYWFDSGSADDPIIFDDPGSAFVFGTLTGSGATSACDPSNAGGVSVVLSARTRIEHLAGNVSVCASGGTGKALVQSEIAPSPITLSNPVTPTRNARCGGGWYPELANWVIQWKCRWWTTAADFSPVADVLADPTGIGSAEASIRCLETGYLTCPVGGTKVVKREFTVDVHASGSRIMDSVAVGWTSSERPPAHGSNRTARVTITKPGSIDCVVDQAPGRTTSFITSFDFSECLALKGQPEYVLDGAKLKVEFTYPNIIEGIGEEVRLSLRGLHIQTNSDEIDAESATADPTSWQNPTAVLESGGTAAVFPEPGTESPQCPATVFIPLPGSCVRTSDTETAPRVITISDFAAGIEDSRFSSDDRISSLLLAITNQSGDDVVAHSLDSRPMIIGKSRVSVQWTAGGQSFNCEAQSQQVHTFTRSSRTYYIDILAGDGSGCSMLKGQPMSILEGAEVSLAISPDRGMWTLDTPHYNVGTQLPRLDYVRLVATTDSIDGIVRSKVTNDADSNTRFRVHGDVVLPRTSLDIDWAGTVDSDPIVNGSLTLDSLGSTGVGNVGIVCCGTGSTEMRLVAQIQNESGDWVTRGVAGATLAKDPASELAAVERTEWQLCGSGGCSLPSSSALGSP